MSIAQSELEQHLWEAANILRGPVDQADFKSYIFPLLFFKRISRRLRRGVRRRRSRSPAATSSTPSFPENHRFQIPDGCHWSDVREQHRERRPGAPARHARDREGQPRDALRHLRRRRSGPTRTACPTRCSRDLIEHFSTHAALGNARVAPDVLGNAYEYLIKQFADVTNKKAGEFYTPRSVVRLMVNILDPQEGETIYDPACGTGGMLLEVVHHVRERRRRRPDALRASSTARRRTSPPPPSPA